MKITKKKIVMASVILILLIIYIKSCAYLPISGTVIEAETGKPIEGAVVLAEWTLTRGAWIGLSTTKSYKVTETLTDKDGRFKINSYVIRPFINKPSLTIYKAGYVCWNNKYIFPGNYKKRTDFEWGSGNTYKISKFKDSYSYVEHDSFISGAINDTIGREDKKLFIKKYYEGEKDKVILERSLRDAERNRGSNK